MKNFILILSFLFFGCGSVSKNILSNSKTIIKNEYMPLSQFKGDTIAYIKKNFIENKDKYLGEKMKVLLNELELPILKYNVGITENLKEVYCISFIFSTDSEIDKKINSGTIPSIINVFIDQPVEISKPLSLLKESKQQWKEKEILFWGSQKIKDIGIIDNSIPKL